ncbi:hypothetical protein Pst134EA_000474 [Puccinia striiformis f. sp. tritici]|nr:hypothetical protein Pst134EA_000474 [Puccinia striiformis f. sp. tritici]KAH9473401.1 hypothetical protein Pst134EA_000474 [Puccinia striiformis f. sp. tritici]
MTQRTYEVDQGCSFTHIRCYNVPVKCAKWHTYCRQTIEKVARKKRARSPNNNDQGLEGSPKPPATSTDSAATDACPESDTGGVLERPIGKKKQRPSIEPKAKESMIGKMVWQQLRVKSPSKPNDKTTSLNQTPSLCNRLPRQPRQTPRLQS